MQIQMLGFLVESKTILNFLKRIQFLKLTLIYFYLYKEHSGALVHIFHLKPTIYLRHLT
jgi:hypothetical protein